ncbi:MAG TPA: YicC family protein [Thermoanaerobaculia bacterium]|nr:YicC family protein [Thermoanaerobaculia bacterium]MDI9630739.1 YicC/YloC family endoribonuclease [Acidobacteriota bacterium]OQC41328.1 MAG: hypothetical protein BWX64_00985 [Acidobacteria bacterium ADurb.Bin051]HNU83629.1 YicC family protein [Thermoanaerobaculia bacterium]HPA95113.1 YicC family protein [Thermoanaerobaculia bacterium]
MRSMTGAGVAHASAEGWRCHVRLASVNHRFLDVVVRLPERLRGREPELRQLVAARLARGRVEVEVAIEPEGDRAVSLALDEAAVEALHQALGTLREKGWIAGELAAGDLLRLPSLLRFGSGDEGWGEGAERLLRDTVTAATDALIAAREAEGERLREALEQRLEAFRALAQRLATRREALRQELLAGLRRRLATLAAEIPVAEERLAQEAALLVERSDVSEELDRLRAHLERFGELLAVTGPVGKQLDFLCQELQREVGTIGAKSRDLATTQDVLAAKLLCEQLREQIQNLE